MLSMVATGMRSPSGRRLSTTPACTRIIYHLGLQWTNRILALAILVTARLLQVALHTLHVHS